MTTWMLKTESTLTTGSNHPLHQLGCCVCLFLLTQLCVSSLPLYVLRTSVCCMLSSLRGKLACRMSVLRVTHVGKQYRERGNFELSTADAGASAGLSSELPATEMSLWRHFEYIGDLEPSRFGPGAHVLHPCLDCLLMQVAPELELQAWAEQLPFSEGQILERGSMVSCWT